jgi:hypothetical protein
MKKKLKDLYNDPQKVDMMFVKAMLLLIAFGIVVGILSVLADYRLTH